MTSRTVPTPHFPTAFAAWPDERAYEGAQKLFSLAARSQAEMLKAALRWQVESLSFLARRGEETVKLLDDLVDDDEFADAFDIVSTYMQNAAMDWVAEAGRLAAAGPKMASETVQILREQADALAEDMAASTVAA